MFHLLSLAHLINYSIFITLISAIRRATWLYREITHPQGKSIYYTLVCLAIKCYHISFSEFSYIDV